MSFAALSLPAPRRRVVTPRLIATLALFVISTTLFCAIVSYVLVRQADDRQAVERRGALLGAVQDIRASGADFARLDAGLIRGLERTAGLKDLRFETEPAGGGREIQSVVDAQGRIVGWFSWEPDRSMAAALKQLQPLLALTGLCLIGFAGLALWQVRRAVRDLGHSEKRAWTLAHEDMLTRLPNHRKMIELIDAALAERARGRDRHARLHRPRRHERHQRRDRPARRRPVPGGLRAAAARRAAGRARSAAGSTATSSPS